MTKIAVLFQMGLWLTASTNWPTRVIVVGDFRPRRVVAGADALRVVVHEADGLEVGNGAAVGSAVSIFWNSRFHSVKRLGALYWP